MKQRILSILASFAVILCIKAQDTTMIMQRPFSGKVVLVAGKPDSSIVGFYKNGKKESVKPYHGYKTDGLYERYYDHGRLMWQKNMKNNIEEGICKYFNRKGEKVAEFRYEKGMIKDTLFITKKETVLIGKATYISKVIGGAVREYQMPVPEAPEDIPYMNFPMYVVSIMDDKTIPVIAERFETDENGMFLLCLQNGSYGFFPGGFDTKKLQPGQYCPLPEMSGSSESSWNMHGPLKVERPSLVFFHLHHSSIGYAP